MAAPRWKGEIGQQGFGFLPADFETAARTLRAQAAEQEQLQPPVTHYRLHPE